MKYFMALIFAILAGCSGHPAPETKKIVLTEEELAYVASHPTITWAAEDSRPPYVLVKDGIVQGLSLDYLQLISKKTGLKFSAIRTGTFYDSIQAVEKKHVNIIPSLRPTPDRSEFMSFTPPYVYNGGVFIFRVNSLPRSPLTTGIRKGEAAEDYLHQRFPDMKVIEVDDDEEAIAQLEKGLVDGVVMDQGAANWWITQAASTDAARVREAVINFDYPYSIGYDKDDHVLGGILTRAVNSISADEKKILNEKWMKDSNAKANP